MKSPVLGRRFRNGERATSVLTDIQKSARDRIRTKIKQGQYNHEQVPCPLCGCDDFELLAERDHYGFPVSTVVCKPCSMLYANPRLTVRALVDMYATDYRDLDRQKPRSADYFDLEVEKATRIGQLLEAHGLLAGLAGKLVLEVGCGAGGGLRYFAERGCEVAGCDLSPRNVQYGVEQGLNLVYGDVAALKDSIGPHSQNVGLVIYEQVLEHLVDPRGELKALSDWLPEDCLLYVGVPGLRNIAAQYGCDFLRFLQLPHLSHFELQTLVAMVQGAGFSFIAGDETARGLFRRAEGATPLEPRDYRALVAYLQGLERRRIIQDPIRKLKAWPVATGLKLRDAVERSSWIPASSKAAIAGLLKKSYRRFMR